MKLVIATPLYPPEIGGPATYVRELEKGLPERGIDVITVKFSDVRHLPKLLRHYAYYRRVRAALAAADAVLALDPVSVGFPAMKAAQKLRKPFVVKIVGDYAWEQGVQRFGIVQHLDDFVRTPQSSFAVRKLQKIQTRVAHAATRVIVPSSYLGKIIQGWGISTGKIIVVPNGIELPAGLSVRQKKPGEFLIVSAGRRVPWKGFETLERIGKKHPEWNVQILSNLARNDALSWMSVADVFVLNSTYEGFPHSLIEAMMLGVPVIATNIGGNAAVVSHGETGILVPVGNDEALEKVIAAIHADPSSAQERARAAKEKMKEFSVERMLDTTAHFLASL